MYSPRGDPRDAQALLDAYTFWQDEADQVRGYPNTASDTKTANAAAAGARPFGRTTSAAITPVESVLVVVVVVVVRVARDHKGEATSFGHVRGNPA